MSTRALLIVNPAAAGGRAPARVPAVRDTLLSLGWDVEVVSTRDGDHAEEAAAQAGPDVVVCSLSGDGNHGRVAAGAVRGGALFAPLPGGRGNDLIRAVGQSPDPGAAAARLAVATERRVDVGVAGGRVFLGVASVGYDTVANTIANEATWLGDSPLCYTYGGLRAALTNRPRDFELTIDGSTRRVRALNVAVGMSGRYGGGVRICPDALIDDGLLDLVVTGAMPLPRFAATQLRTFAGTHVGRPGVETTRLRRVRIACEEPLVAFADGDPIGRLPLDVEVRPGALRLLA